MILGPLEPHHFYRRNDHSIVQLIPRYEDHRSIYVLTAILALEGSPGRIVGHYSTDGLQPQLTYAERIVEVFNDEDPRFIVPIGTRVYPSCPPDNNPFRVSPVVAAASYDHQKGGLSYTLTSGEVMSRHMFVPVELPSVTTMILVRNYTAEHGG